MQQQIASMPNAIAMTAHRAKSRLALLWLVVALVFQGFVIQTHAHAPVGSDWTASGRTIAIAAAADSRRDAPTAPACPLCEEKALFGAYVLGGSITIAAPFDAVYQYAVVALPPLAVRLSSHAWQSRAPPLSTL